MFSLQDFVARCSRFARQPDAGERVLALMREVVRDAASIEREVSSAGPQQAILDAPLFRSPDLTILDVTLQPRFRSAPHDHRMWAVVGIYAGQESNTFYQRTANGLVETGRREIRAGEAVLLGPEVVHAIENPSGSKTRGLHVYGGDLAAALRSMWRPRTHEEIPFDSPQFFRWSAELADRPQHPGT